MLNPDATPTDRLSLPLRAASPPRGAATHPATDDGPIVAPFPTTIYPSAAMAFDGFGDDALGGLDVERLIAELDRPRRRPSGDSRPRWLRELIDCVSQMFEPLSRTGRVGCESTPGAGRWNIGVYLSAAEHIGGPLDGHVETVNFRFDVAALVRCFDTVDSCEWGVFPTPEAIEVDGQTRGDIPEGLSSLKIEGLVPGDHGHPEAVSISVFSVPPAESSVGLRLFADGEAAAV